MDFLQIPVQDLDEDILNSTKLAFDTATGRDADIDDAGDMLCFSASEDEPPVLEGPTGSGRTSKTDPDRSVLHPMYCDTIFFWNSYTLYIVS